MKDVSSESNNQSKNSSIPRPASMIVRVRDHEGHIVAVDYNRDGERWTDAATRLYNACVTPRLMAPDVPRKIGHPVAYSSAGHPGYGVHRLVFTCCLTDQTTWCDQAVTIIVDRRQTQQEREQAHALNGTRERGTRRTGA